MPTEKNFIALDGDPVATPNGLRQPTLLVNGDGLLDLINEKTNETKLLAGLAGGQLYVIEACVGGTE